MAEALITLTPPGAAASAAPLRLRAPGSKSETQRALMLAALAAGESALTGALDCDDSRGLRAGLAACGASISEEGERWLVRGGGLRAPAAALDCLEAGTTLRFLAPLALLLPGELVLDGSPRLRERPLQELLDALAGLGVEATRLGPEQLPLRLRRASPPPADAATAPARAAIDLSRSSQFASGLLLVAPRLAGGLVLELSGQAVSRPYLELTLAMMRGRGATVSEEGGALRVAPGAYRPGPLPVAGDWSSAAFLLAAAWIAGRPLELEGLDREGAQGDRAILALLEELSLPRPHELDLTDCPDLIAPLAAAAAFAAHPVRLLGAAHARLKESDRPAVLAAGLAAAGVLVQETHDGLLLRPGGALRPARLDARGDHRMAMAFALLSLRQGGVEVVGPGCVSKSYPGFWRDLERLR